MSFPKIGLELYTYRLEGTLATPTDYHKVGVIRGERLNMQKSLVDVTSRLANGFRLNKGGLIDGTIDCDAIYLPSNADLQAFETAFFNGTQVLMAFVDGPLQDGDQEHGEPAGSTNVEGLWGAFNVTNFGQARGLEDATTIDIQFAATLEASTNTAPEWKVTAVTLT